MHIIVLGAGVIGVTTAWELVQKGCSVTVVDRQAAVAMETSFANGGQISVSHAEPWANPSTPGKALAWLGRHDAPLLFHCRFDPALFAWCMAFLRQCSSRNTRRNMQRIVELALYSRACLKSLRDGLGQGASFDYDQLSRGILHFYTDKKEWQAAIETAKILNEYGCERRTIDSDECIAIEPALAGARPLIAGGDYHADDESGDAHGFTRLLAERAGAAGVKFDLNTSIVALALDRAGCVDHVVVAREEKVEKLKADAYIVALGSYSALLTRPLGLKLPIYPAKGYSLTFELNEKSNAPTVSLTDDGAKLVFSRLGSRLRVAGTAEFNGYDLSLAEPRLTSIRQRTLTLFPQLAPANEPSPWCGLRPATPSNLPLIGPTRIANLWINSGHGTLGWTLACGSARLLADQLCNGKSDIALPGVL